jgi:hypothetical protein
MSAKFVVVNNYKPVSENVRVNCMRPSVFGNPFSMKDKSLAERNRVCDAFEAHMQAAIAAKSGRLYDGLKALYVQAKHSDGVIELACCCAPARCHVSSIAAFLNSKLGV